ncbi:MAG: YeeE/YedE family protein [Deltaproteobacteria bacterium]|nr:MAG: YeeE/YedE family protein [Deltaproteobacteria bacterium]
MENFTPWASLFGGAMIGLSASILLLTTGRIAGISGIVGGLLSPLPGDRAWRAWFLLGMVAGGLLVATFDPQAMAMTLVRSPGALIAGGLLVGFGTQLGGGCTSGHGVCGISRLSPRSLVATIVFMAFGMASTWVVNHLLGGGL